MIRIYEVKLLYYITLRGNVAVETEVIPRRDCNGQGINDWNGRADKQFERDSFVGFTVAGGCKLPELPFSKFPSLLLASAARMPCDIGHRAGVQCLYDERYEQVICFSYFFCKVAAMMIAIDNEKWSV